MAQLGVIQQQLSTLLASSVTNQNNAAVVIQSATLPTSPIRPQKVRNGILALILGLFLGVLLALFRHRLDIRFKSTRDFEEELRAPVLGAVPHVSGWHRPSDALVLQSDPQSPVAEIFRTLATNFRYAAHEQGVRVVLVTSALREEGKSTISANLAVAIAQAAKRVILISADLRRPRLHRFFGVPNDGIIDVVSGSTTLPEVMHDPGVPNLRFVGSGPTPTDPAAVLGSRRTAELFEEIRTANCDFVVVECPPVLAVADASIMAAHADAVLYVLNAKQTTRSACVQARDQLKNAGARIIGGVYNNFDADTTFPGDYYRLDYRQYNHAPPEQERAENGKSREAERPRARFSR